jgi:hypothetical protein
MGTQIKEVEERCRPYRDQTVDELFDELVRNAREAKGLVEFALSLYGKDTDAKIDAPAVQAFLCSLSLPIYNVEDALPPIIHELRERAAECAAQLGKDEKP